jgi:hypothetical protein
MPSSSAHIAAAHRNQKTIDYLCRGDDVVSPWIATVAFYKALHIVEALFDRDPNCPIDHTDDHSSRNHRLKTTQRYSSLWKHYRALYEASMIARYLQEDPAAQTFDVFSKYMPPAKVKTHILGHHLHQVQETVGRLLKDPNFLSEQTND